MATPAAVLVDAAALVEARQPFVLVTVLWRRAPSSGRAGSRAIILADGSIRGWIGGACAEPTVVEAARRCLQTGEPARLALGEGGATVEAADVTAVPMACESGGALEISLEPVVPPTRVVVIGRSPAVDALASMALALGWDATVIDEGGRPEDHTRPDIVRTKLDLDDLGIDAATAVVVATQGHYDDLAAAAALRTDAGYIGLVASAARAASVRAQLRADGHDDDALARIDAPAGLDLGPVENAEIGAAVIADLVARRARGELRWRPGPARRVAMAVDPVCGMTVDPAVARYHSLHDGHDQWFCASGCKRAFDADPVAYLTT